MINKIVRNFTLVSSKVLKEDPYVIQPALDLLQNKFRRIGLESTILDKRQVIVPAKRVRTIEDTLQSLMPKKECVGFIQQRDEFEELDFIFDNRQIQSILGLKAQQQTPVFIKSQDDEHRVILKEVEYSSSKYMAWAKFERYIVGRPNLIYLPIQVKLGHTNAFLNKGCEFQKGIDGVWVYSYSDTYMTRFELDPQYVTPFRPFKIADLNRMLPYGMALHERYHKVQGTNILTILRDNESFVEDTLKYEMKRKKIESGEWERELMNKYRRQKTTSDVPKKEKKPKKQRSLKKILAAQQEEIKKRISELDK